MMNLTIVGAVASSEYLINQELPLVEIVIVGRPVLFECGCLDEKIDANNMLRAH